ncbi:Presenilins-associated rhomboid-like protein, mitochondrial [Halotydeus destructor]|nr:Presenilins-associated rhomboid-like protein, mitochondrial [Halotydeus destructor]
MSFSRFAFRCQNNLTAPRNLLVKRSVRTGQTSGPSSSRSPNSHLMDIKGLWKPFVYSCAFTGTAFTVSSVLEYEKIKRKATSVRQKLTEFLDPFTQAPKAPSDNFQQIRNEWRKLKESDKLFAGLLLANLLVFGGWHVRSLTPTMFKYFVCSASRKNIFSSMTLTMFSHHSFIHLACNMFVLHSFIPPLMNYMGKEQFLAVYLSSGVVASFFSKFVKVLFRENGVSVGASGAILGVVAFTCLLHPDSQLSVLFLPFISLKAATALKGLMAVDAAGVLLRWRLFDHAAHLGGALAGVTYFYWGQQLYLKYKISVIEKWHTFRTK